MDGAPNLSHAGHSRFYRLGKRKDGTGGVVMPMSSSRAMENASGTPLLFAKAIMAFL
jgi:hypothetical protein